MLQSMGSQRVEHNLVAEKQQKKRRRKISGSSQCKQSFKNIHSEGDFPGGAVDKSLPANVGNMGSIPGLGGILRVLGQPNP